MTATIYHIVPNICFQVGYHISFVGSNQQLVLIACTKEGVHRESFVRATREIMNHIARDTYF